MDLFQWQLHPGFSRLLGAVRPENQFPGQCEFGQSNDCAQVQGLGFQLRDLPVLGELRSFQTDKEMVPAEG